MSERNDDKDSGDLIRTVLDAICAVAPELEPGEIGHDDDLQDDLGLDSMDSLNLVVAICERTGVEIPERDVPGLRSVAAIAAYLAER